MDPLSVAAALAGVTTPAAAADAERGEEPPSPPPPGPSSIARRSHRSQAAPSVVAPNEHTTQARFKTPVVNSFGRDNHGMQIGQNAGSINVVFHNDNHGSLFGSLCETSLSVVASDTERSILESRQRLHAGRRPIQLEHPTGYSPYITVESPKVKAKLLSIAHIFQFLDRGFAEYFRVVVPSFGQHNVRNLLDSARKSIARSQIHDPSQEDSSKPIYLGDLGNFCEELGRGWEEPNPESISNDDEDKPVKEPPKFTTRHGREHEILYYLQDAFEVPYWEFMLDLFLRWRVNSTALSGDVVLRVLDSVKLDLLDGKRQLLDELGHLSADKREDIGPILKGIDARIKLLESVWDGATSNLYQKHSFLESIFQTSQNVPVAAVEEPPCGLRDEPAKHPTEAVVLTALILVFLTAAIVPGYKAFAISMQSSTSGSTDDADFWYLVQNSIMAVMGNIIMVVPLLGRSWFSPAYGLMWMFFTVGMIFAVTAIAIYPFCNTGWSSMVSFFGSVASAASVLVMTQAGRMDENRAPKIKPD